MSADRLRFHVDRGLPPAIWVGEATAHIVSGWWFHPSKRLRRLSMLVGEQPWPIRHTRDFRPDVANALASEDPDGRSLLSGFCDAVPLVFDSLELRSVGLRFEWRDGTVDAFPLGQIRFVASPEPSESPTVECSPGPALVICLGTYRPNLEAFRRQIDSIVKQTFTDWVCVVNDDGSSQETLAAIREICACDSRFRVFGNAHNVGFYRNFERALWHAKRLGPSFVALADQDDYWYPDKLERCMEAFDENTSLVYCDMKIVRSSGEVVSDTYWFSRRNNYTDADVVFLANTVTGAASVFRGSLLEKVLPFPERIGDCFHDHWIACCALADGHLRYVDKPLYEYIQYGTNIIGHCSLEGQTWVRSLKASVGAVLAGAKLRRVIRESILYALETYHSEYRRLELFGRILRQRFPCMATARARAFRLADGSWASVGRLLAAHLRYFFTGATTGDAEIRLGYGFVVAHLTPHAVRLLPRRLIQRIRTHFLLAQSR